MLVEITLSHVSPPNMHIRGSDNPIFIEFNKSSLLPSQSPMLLLASSPRGVHSTQKLTIVIPPHPLENPRQRLRPLVRQ